MNADEALFLQVLDEFGPALERLARSYEHDLARAEDLYQEVCLALWKALPRWQQRSTLRTFVFRIAHNRGLTHGWRAAKRGTVPLLEARDLPDLRQNAAEKVEEKQRRNYLLAAVHRLPLALRQAVTLKLEGFSNSEIADVLGISPGAVRVRLHRGQTQLAATLPALFSPAPIEPSSGASR